MDDLKIELHKNIFANIYELKFINQDYLITIDTISKSLLRDIVELHYINFINELITTPNIREKYNFIHNIGYISFIPEGDPIIAPGSIFLDLESLRGALEALEKIKGESNMVCHSCNRRKFQRDIFQCSRCRKTKYCCKLCQMIDYPQHKKRCK
jgi:hypothetical protein